MTYSEEELHEYAEAMVKADEIRNNTELMKELEPYMKEKMMRIDKILSLKDLWKKGALDAAEKENNEEMKEKLTAKEPKEKLKNTDDNGSDPLEDEKPKVAKS